MERIVISVEERAKKEEVYLNPLLAWRWTKEVSDIECGFRNGKE